MSAVISYNVRRIGFTVITRLRRDEALDRLAKLLEAGGAKDIEIDRDRGMVRSSSMPFPVANVDPRWYSRRNGIGVNPFAILTAIELTAAARGLDTVVSVQIDRLRAILIAIAEILLVLFIALSAPLWPTLAIAGVIFVLSALVMRLSRTLVQFEIKQQLQG